MKLLVPKFWFAHAPHSRLAAGFKRLQSGTRFPLRGSPAGKKLVSFHDRVVLVARRTTGLSSYSPPPPGPFATNCVYLPRLTFTAVLPVPNTSYTKLIRGVMVFKPNPSDAGNA